MSSVYKQSRLKKSSTEVKVLRIPRFTHDLNDNGEAEREQRELAEAESVAARLIADAEEMAEKMLAQTKQDIARLRAEVEEERSEILRRAESEREEELERARSEGYQAGFESGQNEGRQSAQDEYETLIDSARETVELANQEKRQALLEAETFLVTLSSEIARKVVMDTVEIQPDLVVRVVKATLKRIKERESVSIFAHPTDYHLLLSEKKQLLDLVNERVELKVCPDHSVDRGSCVIRSSQGSVDARIDTQLSEISSQLLELAKATRNE